MPESCTLEVLVISETGPTGDELYSSIVHTIGAEYNCRPISNREDFDRSLKELDRFQAVLLGNDLGWSTGIDIIPEITGRRVSVKIIMITDSNGADLVADGFRLGLDDFMRSSQLDRLLTAISGVDIPSALRLSHPSEFAEIIEPDQETQALSSVVSDYVFSFYVHQNGTIVNEWRSEGLERISGYTPEEFAEIGWERIILEEDHETLWQRTRSVLRGNAPVTEYRLRNRSGEVRWIREYTRPIWDSSENRCSRFVGSAQDITEERISTYLKSGQMHILELIAIGADFSSIFDETVRLFSVQAPEPACAVHRFHEQDGTLRLIRDRNLTAEYRLFLERLNVDLHDTVQTASVASQQLVVVPDARQEDRWDEEMRLVQSCDCTSQIVMPIIGTRHNILGTLTVCRRETGEPSASYLERTTIASRLLGIAIEKIENERQLARAQLRYKRLAEEIPAITFVATADDTLLLRYLSPQAEAIIDETVLASWDQLSLLDIVHPADRRAVATSFRQLNADPTSVLIEFRVNPDYGEDRWLQCSAAMIDDHPEDEISWQGILLDVTSRRNAELALRESQTQFRALFDNNPHIVFTLDTRGRFQRINPASMRITGYQEEDLVGRPFTSVLVAGELERVWQFFRDTITGDSQQFETEIFTKRGKRVQISVTTVPYILDGQVAGVSGIAEDITHRVRLQDQLSYQAFHDSLTGLPNRTLFSERLNQAITTIERTREQVAVLFVDLDNFKTVNDSLGHENGDEYLKIIANWLTSCVGPSDTVARFGGDEFTVLLKYSLTDQGYPLRVAERVGRELTNPVVIQGHEINTGVSIGIAIYDRHNREPDDLIRQADIALYQAKRAGTGQLYQVYQDSMHQRIIERLEYQRDLRRAIRQKEFVVYYQPIIELSTGRVVKLEALVRWMHPERGLLAPGEFLPIAEETGQITEIDELVMKIACREVAELNRHNRRLPPLSLGINLSARDFRRPDLVDRIMDTVNDTGFDATLLRFEITESTMMQDVTETLAVLNRLREFGIGFSIDDFGTGYSSLAYLQRFPLDTLKIDRTFVDGLGGNGDDDIIVQTIINLAKSLRLETIAEGIETNLQLERARELGCDRAQGYLIAHPLPLEQLHPMLQASSPGRDDQRHSGFA